MRRSNRIPLAWKNLTHNLRRLGLAAGGIGFAVLLIFMQLGFRGALFDSTVQLPRLFNADLIMVNSGRFTITVKQVFSRARLHEARACREVVAAWPLYLDPRPTWKNVGSGQSFPIRTIGFNPLDPVLLSSEVVDQSKLLLIPGNVLFDRLSKSDYGRPAVGATSEVSGHRAKIAGQFSLGTDFANDGNLIVSDIGYANFLFPPGQQDAALEKVDFGLLKLAPGANPQAVVEKLQKLLPPDVKIATKEDYVAGEQRFWSQSTPIGYIFGFGTALGFVVGVIICYQILYADISDHLPEYATLKAMGYRGGYFVSVVLQEAVLLALLGFVPGLVVSLLLYEVLSQVTGLLLNLTALRAVGVLALTVVMCVISGLLTMRKVVSADPAELFA